MKLWSVLAVCSLLAVGNPCGAEIETRTFKVVLTIPKLHTFTTATTQTNDARKSDGLWVSSYDESKNLYTKHLKS